MYQSVGKCSKKSVVKRSKCSENVPSVPKGVGQSLPKQRTESVAFGHKKAQ